jgi:oligopeptide transport system substrate-binding protein
MMSKNVRNYSSRVALSAALVGISLALAGCMGGRKDPYAGMQVLRTPIKDEVKSLDPANAYDSVSLDVLPHIAETLYQYEWNNPQNKIIPLLAADLPTFSKDHLTVTIQLKKGIKFSDDAAFKATNGKGRELKAQDFVYAIKRLAHPGVQSNGAWIFEGKLKGFSEFQKSLRELSKDQLVKTFAEANLDGVKAVGDHTLQLQFVKPYPLLMHMLSMTFTSPMAKEVVDAYADERGQLNDRAIGTGPFILEKWERGHSLVLAKSPSFRGDAAPAHMGEDAGKQMPFLDKVVFEIMKEEQPMWLNFQKGELELGRIPKDSYSQAIGSGGTLSDELKNKGIQLDIVQANVFYWINFNTKDKALSNKYLRQAISSTINREQWIELFTNGRGKKQVTAAPSGLADRVENATLKYDFNIARAKELLKKAGYPDGKGLPELTLDMRGSDSTNRQLGEFITKQLSQANIPIKVTYNTFPAFLEKSKKGQLQISYGGWVLDYPDVENVYQLLYGPNAAPGPNDANYDRPEFNKLYEQMSIMEPGPARAKLVKQMDDMVQEDTPWAMGFYRDEYTLYQGWVKNFKGSFYIRDNYKYLRIDKENKKQVAQH